MPFGVEDPHKAYPSPGHSSHGEDARLPVFQVRTVWILNEPGDVRDDALLDLWFRIIEEPWEEDLSLRVRFESPLHADHGQARADPRLSCRQPSCQGGLWLEP